MFGLLVAGLKSGLLVGYPKRAWPSGPLTEDRLFDKLDQGGGPNCGFSRRNGSGHAGACALYPGGGAPAGLR